VIGFIIPAVGWIASAIGVGGILGPIIAGENQRLRPGRLPTNLPSYSSSTCDEYDSCDEALKLVRSTLSDAEEAKTLLSEIKSSQDQLNTNITSIFDDNDIAKLDSILTELTKENDLINNIVRLQERNNKELKEFLEQDKQDCEESKKNPFNKNNLFLIVLKLIGTLLTATSGIYLVWKDYSEYVKTRLDEYSENDNYVQKTGNIDSEEILKNN